MVGRQTRRIPKVDRPKVDRPNNSKRVVKVKKRKQPFLTPGPNQCHPRVSKGVSCIPLEVLEDARKKLGLRVNKSLLETIAASVGVKPTDQRSLLMSLPLEEDEKKRLATYYLRPPMPEAWKQDPDMWLDSNNIRDVMKQYEEARPDFKFLGPYPIDFASQDPYVDTPAGSIVPKKEKEGRCLIGEMCRLDLKAETAAGKKHIGIVYNLDPHYKNGSHWIANYINIPKKQCYYFDSYGMKPPKQIYKFMQWLGIQEPAIELGWNGRRFQHSNSECGMYSMYFIDRMLAGEPFLHFCRRAPPDRFMLDMRDWMFST